MRLSDAEEAEARVRGRLRVAEHASGMHLTPAADCASCREIPVTARPVEHDHYCRCGASYTCPPGCQRPIRVETCGECEPVRA